MEVQLRWQLVSKRDAERDAAARPRRSLGGTRSANSSGLRFGRWPFGEDEPDEEAEGPEEGPEEEPDSAAAGNWCTWSGFNTTNSAWESCPPRAGFESATSASRASALTVTPPGLEPRRATEL